MLIPFWPAQSFACGKNTVSDVFQGAGPFNIEKISVKRVLESLYTKSENNLQISIYEVPKEILSCRAKNLILTQRLIRGPSGKHNLAIAIYNYEVEVTYYDSAGKIKQVYLPSGLRHEQIFVRSSMGCLKAVITLDCIYNGFTNKGGTKIFSLKNTSKVKPDK